MKSLWKILAVVAGISLFGWSVSGVGLPRVWEAILRLGAFAPLICIPYLIVYVVDCAAWARTFPPNGIPFLTLLRIRWAGESVNNVFPSAYIGGEAVKVCLLRKHGIRGAEGTTIAIVSKTAQSLAQLVFIVAASVLLLQFAHAQPGLRPGVLLVVVSGTTVMASLFWVQKAGCFRLGLGFLGRVGCRFGWLERRRAQLLELDEIIARFYQSRPGSFYASTGLYWTGWLLDSVEIYLVAHLLGMPIHWTQALIVEAFTGVAKALGMWIPGSLGVQESGIVLMGRITGLPDALSASYAVIRRLREMIFAAAGLLLLYGTDTLRPTAEAKAATQ